MEKLMKALRYGHVLDRPDLWANRALVASMLSAMLSGGLAILDMLGIECPVKQPHVEALTQGLAAGLALLSTVLHAASNPHAGAAPGEDSHDASVE